MSILTRLVLLAGSLIVTSCATLSDKQLDYPELQGDVHFELEFPPKFERGRINHPEQPDEVEEYEKAKEECANLGGNWISYLHADDWQIYRNTYRCMNLDEPPPPGDPAWDQKGLLRYEIAVTYSLRNNNVIKFTRIYPISDQDDPSDQGTD